MAPHIAQWDREAHFPVELVPKMGDLGLFGLVVPEQYGGADADFMSLVVAIEELGRVDQSIGITLSAGVGLGINPILSFGSEEQKEQFLPDLVAGRALAAFGLTEPGGGSDAGATRTRATLDGDQWVLNGAKAFITNSGADITSVVTVTARTGTNPDGTPQISAILVPAGFEIREHHGDSLPHDPPTIDDGDTGKVKPSDSIATESFCDSMKRSRRGAATAGSGSSPSTT